jgi:hypothetical protein
MLRITDADSALFSSATFSQTLKRKNKKGCNIRQERGVLLSNKQINKRENPKTMNTFIKITALVILNSLFAAPMKANNGTEISTEKQIQKQLNVNCPALSAEEHTKVDVLFTNNEEGKVNLVIIKTENEDIRKEIEKNFSKLILPNLKHNVCYGVTLNIRAK